ncbi:MAG: DUF2188 domain-containing protein [Dongiaceae bacterium]
MSNAPKNSRRSQSDRAESGRNDRYVVPSAAGWVVRKGHSTRASGIYGTRADAERAAKEMVRIKGGEVRIQGPDGRLRESFTIGRKSFAKISAVEGIRLSREMAGDLREFDRKGLSDDERRMAIVKKYGRKPG